MHLWILLALIFIPPAKPPKCRLVYTDNACVVICEPDRDCV